MTTDQNSDEIVFEACRTPGWLLATQAGLGVTAFLFLGAYGLMDGQWAAPIVGAVIACGVGWLLWARRRQMRRRIVVDIVARTITFEHFVVMDSFLPKPPIPRLTMPFTDVLGTKFYRGGRGADGLTIYTARGRIGTSSDTIQRFTSLQEVLDRIAGTNAAETGVPLAEQASGVPGVVTPWYGWVILAIGVAAVLAVCIWVIHITA